MLWTVVSVWLLTAPLGCMERRSHSGSSCLSGLLLWTVPVPPEAPMRVKVRNFVSHPTPTVTTVTTVTTYYHYYYFYYYDDDNHHHHHLCLSLQQTLHATEVSLSSLGIGSSSRARLTGPEVPQRVSLRVLQTVYRAFARFHNPNLYQVLRGLCRLHFFACSGRLRYDGLLF